MQYATNPINLPSLYCVKMLLSSFSLCITSSLLIVKDPLTLHNSVSDHDSMVYKKVKMETEETFLARLYFRPLSFVFIVCKIIYISDICLTVHH
jgi:hypothetical protein